MTEIKDFNAAIKSGAFGGVFVFGGEEEYLKRYYLGELRAAILTDEAFAVFNNPVFDGEEIDFSAIAEAIKAPPVMSDYKLIEWRHADFTALSEKGLSSLEEIASLCREYPYATVAFVALSDGLDFGVGKRQSKFITRFDKSLKILRLDKSGDRQLLGWLKRHFDSRGVEVSLDTLNALIFTSGRSMDVLIGEVEKLAALAHSRGQSAVSVKDVAEVASPVPESEAFALSNAIVEKNRAAAFTALYEMKSRRVEPAVVIGMISHCFGELASVGALTFEGTHSADIATLLGMSPYKVGLCVSGSKRYGSEALARISSEIARVDAESKFGGLSGYTAIELFLAKYL